MEFRFNAMLHSNLGKKNSDAGHTVLNDHMGLIWPGGHRSPHLFRQMESWNTTNQWISKCFSFHPKTRLTLVKMGDHDGFQRFVRYCLTYLVHNFFNGIFASCCIEQYDSVRSFKTASLAIMCVLKENRSKLPEVHWGVKSAIQTEIDY